MKADERKDLDENSLAHGFEALVERAKTGRLVNLRLLGVVLAVAVVGGVWWYAARAGRKADAIMWRAFEGANTQQELNEFAEANKDSVAGRLARLEAARIQLGPQGIGQLPMYDRAERNKGIGNIDAARKELLDLANSFKGDPTFQATCLLAAVEAELALAGVSKDEGGQPLGSAKAAADLYRQVVAVVGEASPVGEQAKKRAEELDKQADQVADVGRTLNRVFAPPPSFSESPPGTGPKAPDAPPGAPPKAPELPKADEPKAPTTPPSPATTPNPAPAPAPAPNTPAAPPPAAPKADPTPPPAKPTPTPPPSGTPPATKGTAK